MPVRMKDIAEDIGVSIITVSKALRNHPDISAETRARVLKRIKELNYQPNFAARALATGRTFSAGLIVPDLVHPFFAELAKGLSQVLNEAGYGLLISSSQEQTALEEQQIDQMLARGVDALLLASVQATPDAVAEISKRKVVCVLIDRCFPGWTGNFVGMDDRRVGLMATEHLISAGCRAIAHIRGGEVSTALGRLEGYRDALCAHGLQPEPEYVVSAGTADEQGDVSGYRAMQRLLRLERRPDGVFCFNDPAAMGAMQAILDAGLRIPEDVALIGCGNVLYSGFLRVPLSSIDQQSAEMGRRIGRLTLGQLGKGRRRKPGRVLIEPRLVVRDSTRRRSTAAS